MFTLLMSCWYLGSIHSIERAYVQQDIEVLEQKFTTSTPKIHERAVRSVSLKNTTQKYRCRTIHKIVDATTRVCAK